MQTYQMTLVGTQVATHDLIVRFTLR